MFPSLRRSRTGRALASSLQHSSYQRLSASEPDLPSPRLETAPPPSTARRRQPLTRGQATELPETPAAERPSPIGAEQTVRRPVTTTASSSQLSLISADSELWDELRGIVCERERRCWANFLLWEQRRGLYRPASVPGNMQRLSEERRSRRQVIREVVRRLYPGGRGRGGAHRHAPPGDATEPDWCCCGQRKRPREASTESRPYEKRSRLMNDSDEAGQPVSRLRRRSSGDHGGRSPAAGAQSSSTPNVSRFPRPRPRAADTTPIASAPSSQRDLSQLKPAPAVATLSCSVDEGLGGSFDVCVPPTFSDDSLEPSDLGLSQDSLDMIDADSVEDLTAGKRRIDSLFRPALNLPVVAAPVLVHQVEYRKQPQEVGISHRKSLPEVTGIPRKSLLEVTGHRKSVPNTVIRISMARPTMSSDSEWGSAASSLERRQTRTARAEIRRRAEERFSCSGASDSEEEQRFVSATDRTAGDTPSLLTAEDASDSASFQSALGEPDRWSACSEREPASAGHPVIHFPSPPPPEVFIDECGPPSPVTPSPTAIVHPFRSDVDAGDFNNGEDDPSDDSPTAACRLYTIVESAGESDGAIDSRAAALTHARPSATPAIASKHGDVDGAASVASVPASAAGGRSVLGRTLSGDRLPACDAEWRRWRARQAAAAAPAAAGWIDADMWERYVSRLDVRSHLLLEEARRRPGLAVSLLVRSRSLPDLAERPAGGHVSRLFRSALSVTVHGRPPPQPEQRILYSLPPEVRERSTVGPPVESIPEGSDVVGSTGSGGSSSSRGSRSSSSSDGSDGGSEDDYGAGGGRREPGDGAGQGEERVVLALDEDEPPQPLDHPDTTAEDVAGLSALAGSFGSLSDAPPVFSDASGDGINIARPSEKLDETYAADDVADQRAGEMVTSEATTERLTERIETTETHRDARHAGPRILTYEIVEEVNVFVRGSGETRVSTSRSASVTRVPAAVEEDETRQSEVTSSQDISVMGRPGEALEQTSRTHKVWDYRTEVLHVSPKCRQVVTSTLDVETRVRDAPPGEPEGYEHLYTAESGGDGSEPPSLENWASDELPPVQQRPTGLVRQPSEQPPSLEPWAPAEAPHLTHQLSEQPPSLEPWAPDQPTSIEQPTSLEQQPSSLEQQPPSLEPWTSDEAPHLTRQSSEQPPSLEPWAPDQPSSLEQQPPSLEQQPPSVERRASDQPPSLEQWMSDQPPSLEQWAPDQPTGSGQWAPGADRSPAERTGSPSPVCVAAPLNIAERPGVGVAAGRSPCPDPVTAPGRESDGFHSERPTAADLSPSAPFADTHGRVPPSPFRLITNVEDEEVQISNRQGRSVSRVHPATPDANVATAEHVTMTSQEPTAPTAPFSTAAVVCDPQMSPGGDRPGLDSKAAAVVRPADESRVRPADGAAGIDSRSFVDRQPSSESISGDGATGKALSAPWEVIDPDLTAERPGGMESPVREHSLSDKIERWSRDPPAIFIFEVEEHGALLRRDETRFIDADAEVDKPSAAAAETQSPGASARSPRTPAEEQFFFFKTTEEEPSLETIEEEIVEAFDESSSSLSSSSSSSHSKNTSRDVDGESLRSDLTGVGGTYDVNPSAVSSPDTGSPRKTEDKDTDKKEDTEIDTSKERLSDAEDDIVVGDRLTKDEATNESPMIESLNLIKLSSDGSLQEASDPACGAREGAGASEPVSGPGGTPSGSGASMSSNVQADRELEEVSGRLEVMSSSALFGKADSEGDESGTMAEPRSGSPRLPETPERPDGAARQETLAEQTEEIKDDMQDAELEQRTSPADDNDSELSVKKGEESEVADNLSEVPAPREAWMITAPPLPELSHAVSVGECEEFKGADEELTILPPMTTVAEQPLEMLSAAERWEEVTPGELSEVPTLPWRDQFDNGTPEGVSEEVSKNLDDAGKEENDPSADLPQTFVDNSIESDSSLPSPIHPELNPSPPEISAPFLNEEASELATSTNRSLAFEEAQVTSPVIDPWGAPPAEPPIDTEPAASEPGQVEVGRAAERTEEEAHDPVVAEQVEVLCYPDDSSETPEMEEEQLEGEREDIDRSDSEGKNGVDGTHVVVETVESTHQYSEVIKVMDNILCCPDATKEAPLIEFEQLESDEKSVEQHDDDQSTAEKNGRTLTAVEMIEEDLHGPAKEEVLIDILCFGDATSEAPTLELEQLDFVDKSGDTDAKNDAASKEALQATESIEQESKGPVDVEETVTVLCLATSSEADIASEQNDPNGETATLDTQPVVNEEQAAESVTEAEQNLQVKGSAETILCYADDTKAVTTLDFEIMEDVDVQIPDDSKEEQVVREEVTKHQVSETTASGVHSPAIQTPSANVLCLAGSEMMALEVIEVEMLEDEVRSQEAPDHNASETNPNDQNAFKLAESIVHEVMSKASNILECDSELEPDQKREDEKLGETKQSLSEKAEEETITVTQFSNPSEKYENSERAPEAATDVSGHSDDVEEKASTEKASEEGEQKPSEDHEKTYWDEELLDQIVGTASEVHVTQHPMELLASDEKGGFILDSTNILDRTTSNETAEPVAVRRSSYLCGSERSASEDEVGPDEAAEAISPPHLTPRTDEALGEEVIEVVLSSIDLVEHSNVVEPSRDVEGSKAEMNPVEAAVVTVPDVSETERRGVIEPSREVEDSEAREVDPVEMIVTDVDMTEHNNVTEPGRTVENSKRRAEAQPFEVVENAPADLDVVEHRNNVEPSRNVDGSEAGIEPQPVENVEIASANIHADEYNDIIQSSREVEGSGAERDPDEVVSATVEVGEDMSEENENASEVHEVTPGQADPSTATVQDNATEPLAFGGSSHQCGSHQSDDEAASTAGSESPEDSKSPRSEIVQEVKNMLTTGAMCGQMDTGRVEHKDETGKEQISQDKNTENEEPQAITTVEWKEDVVADPSEAEGHGSSHISVTSVSVVETIEFVDGKDVPESGIVTQHLVVTDADANMQLELLHEDVITAANYGDERAHKPFAHDSPEHETPVVAETVESCSPAGAAGGKEAGQTNQPSEETAEELAGLDISGEVKIDQQEGNEAPADNTGEAAKEGSSLDPAMTAISSEFQRHLLEEVEEQTPSLDTIESFETEGRDEPEEMFYSFDTEDETMLDAMKAPQDASRSVSSLCQSEEFTEITITVRDSKTSPVHSESEDDSEDSSSETPRIPKQGLSLGGGLSDPEAEKLQQTRDTEEPAIAILTQPNETPVQTTRSDGITIEGLAIQSRQDQDLQRNSKTDDHPHASGASSTVSDTHEPHDIQEQSGKSSSNDQTGPCGAVRKEEEPLTSFSDVSQVKPLILNRAQSLSMSDESETDDWDPPSPPTRRQPLLKLDIRPRTSLGELDGALSPREAVPQQPVARPLRAITPTLTNITETEGDLREDPLQVAAFGQLARYSHNFGADDDNDETAVEEKTTPRSPTPPTSPNAERKVQMWQQYVELQHAADEEPTSPPQPLSTSDIMYLYIESATGAGSTSELSEIGLSAAVPRHEHRASAVRLERTVSADCVRRRQRAGLARCSSADGLLQRGRPPVDIANIIALGRLPLTSPEHRDDADGEERGRGKKCVSWSDIHGSGELEVIHGSPDGELPHPMAVQSDSEASSSGEESEEEPDLVVGGSRHRQPSSDFGLAMPDEVRRRARRYLPQHTQPTQLEIANWDLIGQDVGVPLVEAKHSKRVVNAATQTLRDASSQTDCIEDMTLPPENVSSGQYQIPQPSSGSYGNPYSSFSNYNGYPTSRAYDFRNSFNNPGLHPDPQIHNFHDSSNYDSFSRSHLQPHIPADTQRYSFEYSHREVYRDQSSAPLYTSGSRASSLERQICRELASLRQHRERSRGYWDGDMERHRRLLQVENSLQKSLQQMRALVARRRAHARVLIETLPAFQPSSRHGRGTTLPAYRQTTVVPSAGLDARLSDIGGSYDKVDFEYGSGGPDFSGRLREAPSVTHVLHQEIHVPPCCNHAPPPARPAAAAGSPRRMTPSQYRQHLAAIRRRILAQPPGTAVRPPPLPSDAPSRSRRTDPWGTSEQSRPGHSVLTRSEPNLSRAGGVWRSEVPPTVAGSTGDLGPRLYATRGGFVPTDTGRAARHGLY